LTAQNLPVNLPLYDAVVLVDGVIPPAQFFLVQQMFVAVRHHPVGTLKRINDGGVKARLRHSRQHRALVFIVDQGHRFVLIGIKKNRVIRTGIAAKLLAKRIKLALNELFSFCA
jgi:hypothetical protein